jgi:hypothetical protein
LKHLRSNCINNIAITTTPAMKAAGSAGIIRLAVATTPTRAVTAYTTAAKETSASVSAIAAVGTSTTIAAAVSAIDVVSTITLAAAGTEASTTTKAIL